MPKSHCHQYLLIFHYICTMIDYKKIDWNWIKGNESADTTRLRLSAHGNEQKLFEIIQIDCRQRVKEKLADTLASMPKFIFPSTLSAQQSTSDLLASYHAQLIEPGWRVLDMTCGLGIDAHYICQKAAKVTICDIDPDIATCAKENFQQSGIKNVEVLNCDSVNYISELPTNSYDCIFIDPARRGSHGERLYALSQCFPDVTAILNEMLRVAPNIIIKASPMLDIQHTLSELHNTEMIIALGTRSECKELVIICRRDFSENTLIQSVTLNKEKNYITILPIDTNFLSDYGDPKVGDYIFEPYPSLLKVGCYGFVCQKYNLKKIAKDSHIYHSENVNLDFPGTAHKVLWIEEMSKKTLKELTKLYPNLDITAKNFPLTSAELSARLRVKPSGSIRLFACKNASGKKMLIVCERI